VKIVLARGEVNSDRVEDNGQTPLYHGVRNGHEGAVMILLGWVGSRPDRIDHFSGTLLSHAAMHAPDTMVKMLRRPKEVNPAKPDHDG